MRVKADLHIHSVLSPCGDLEMDPLTIVERAKEEGLSIIAICDHNTTRQSRYMVTECQSDDLLIIGGVEINSREDIHAVVLFEDLDSLDKFQTILERYLPKIKNRPDKFGYQVAANRDGEIFYEEENLLISALDLSFEEIYREVKGLGGVVIPAHMDRSSYSIISQLGFIPLDLELIAVELSYQDINQTFSYLNKGNYPEITSSDAHYPKDIGRGAIEFEGERSYRSLIEAITKREFKPVYR